MKRRHWPRIALIALVVVMAAGACLYAARGTVRNVAHRLVALTLPKEEAYEVIRLPTDEPLEEPVTPSEKPPKKLPSEKRLAVPFTSQAPYANWDMPYQEACEEASILMVAAYYNGESGTIPKDEADERILDLVAFEEDELGLPPDITAAEVKQVIEAQYPRLRAEVLPLEGAEQIKRFIVDGIPVIVPANGKTLPNPNFRNGGPKYHMLVVRGYTATHFITNDPGTRLGENFKYTYDGLLDSVRDWNGGDVPNGKRVILVVRPKS